MAGMGFDAHLLDATNDTAKKHIGWLAYAAGPAQHLRECPCTCASSSTASPSSPPPTPSSATSAGFRAADCSPTASRLLDGDLIDPASLLVTVRPKAVLLCMPQSATDPDIAQDAAAVDRGADEVRETTR